MQKPERLSFTDFEVPASCIFRGHENGPMNLTWTRVQFTLPDSWEAIKQVQVWLRENCPGQWSASSFADMATRYAEHRHMVVRFEDKNDAMMFKLRGGHQAWQNS